MWSTLSPIAGQGQLSKSYIKFMLHDSQGSSVDKLDWAATTRYNMAASLIELNTG